VLPLLDEELQRLPEKYRTPLMLCYLQGLTNQEAAEQLGCPIGTVFTRLARGRNLLHVRLARRGVTLSAGLLGTALAHNADAAPLPLGLVQATVRAAVLFATGSTTGALSPNVLALTEGALKMMWLDRLKVMVVALVLFVVAGSGAGLLAFRATAREQGDAPPEPRAAAAKPAETAPKLPKEALRYGGKDFQEWRLTLMTDLKPAVRVEAIEALSTLGAKGYGSEAAVAILEAARDYDLDHLDGHESHVLDASRFGLRKIGADAVVLLMAEVKTGKKKDRRFALGALEKMGVAAKDALPAVLEALREDDPAIRVPAILAARAMDREGTSVPALGQALTSSHDQIRYDAIEALEHFGAKAKAETPRLITVSLQDSRGTNRYRAIAALAHINPEAKTVLPALMKALKDEDQQVRLEAMAFLGKLGPDAAEAVPDLIALLKTPRLEPGEARYIADALGSMGPAAKAAAPTLTGFLNDERAILTDGDLRGAVMRALQSINK
jgi:HEAT repeat protein